jgi:hypothetical protein
VTTLISHWSEFPAIAAESEQNVLHIARLVAYAPEQMLTKEPFAEGPVAAGLSMDTREVLSERIEFDLSRLSQMNVEVVDLPSLAEFPEVVEFVVDKGLHQVNIPNIHFIFERIHSSAELNSLESRHFTTILESGNETLISCVEADFIRYVRHVLLKLDCNTAEEGFAILAALRHDEVSTEYLEEYWGKQSAILPSLAEIPYHLHPYALEHNRIGVSWENCLTFLSSESFSSERLTTYLQDAGITKALFAMDIPNDKETLPVRQFLLNNEDFDSVTYRSYVSKLPREFKDFPNELSHEKLRILTEERRISFSVQNFEFLEDQLDLRVLFVEQNIDTFLSASGDFKIDDDFRMGLLGSKISDEQKKTIVQDMDPVSIATDATRASVVGPIFDRTNFEPDEVGFDFLHSIIVNSTPASVQISLLNKSNEALSDEQVRSIFEGLPEPYSDIATFGKSPKVENAPFNQYLVEWLEQRKIISSWKPTLTEKEIRIHTFRRAEEKTE